MLSPPYIIILTGYTISPLIKLMEICKLERIQGLDKNPLVPRGGTGEAKDFRLVKQKVFIWVHCRCVEFGICSGFSYLPFT